MTEASMWCVTRFTHIPMLATGSIAQSEFMRAARKYGLNMNVEQTAKLTDFYGSVNGCISKEAFVERAKCVPLRDSWTTPRVMHGTHEVLFVGA